MVDKDRSNVLRLKGLRKGQVPGHKQLGITVLAAQVCSTPQSILFLIHYAGLLALSTANLARGELGNKVQAMANHDLAHLNPNEPDTVEVYIQSVGAIFICLA